MMKLIPVLAALCFLLPAVSHAADGKAKPLDAVVILKKTDSEKNTRAQINEYAREIKGKEAQGTGRVVKVLEGRRDQHRVTVLVDVTRPSKGYNIVLYTEMDAPKELKTGDSITFSGEVGRVSAFRGTSVDIHGTYRKTGKNKK